MQKHFLRIIDLEKQLFEQLLRDVMQAQFEDVQSWKQSLSNVPIHVWRGSEEAACIDEFRTLLEELDLAITLHDCSESDLEGMETLAKAHSSSINILLGVSEIYAEGFAGEAQSVCFYGAGLHAAPYEAMAEVALLQENVQDLNDYRVCWLGGITGLGQSLIEAAIYVPMELFMGIPPWGDPKHSPTALALKAGAKVFLTREPELAIDESSWLYLDSALATMAAKASPTQKPLGTGLESYDWNQGFLLTPVYANRAKEPLCILPTQMNTHIEDAAVVVDAALAARRTVLRKHMLLRLLAHTASML